MAVFAALLSQTYTGSRFAGVPFLDSANASEQVRCDGAAVEHWGHDGKVVVVRAVTSRRRGT
jgi:hypothetical protein